MDAFCAVEYAAEEKVPVAAALGEHLLQPYPISVLQPVAAADVPILPLWWTSGE